MKRALLYFAVLTLAGAAMAQGTIEFLSYDPPNGVNGRFYYLEGPPPHVLLAGSDWAAQLYVGTGIDSLRPVGRPVSFGEDAFGNGTGIVNGGVVTVQDIEPGVQVIVHLRVWSWESGASWDAAAGAASSVAIPITVALGGGGLPPAHLSGLSEFSYPLELIPEPSSTWLALLGLPWCWWVSGAAVRRTKPPRQMD